MKFIIYGAGKRGKDELKALGKENILAFVDRDPEKIGTTYDGIPVVDMLRAKEMAREALCIVTPVFGRKSITEYLENNGINNYLFMAPFDQMLLYTEENIFTFLLEQYENKNIGIYGISAGTISLYEYLVERTDTKICLIPDDMLDEEKYAFLRNRIRILDWNEAVQKVDVVVSTVLYPKKDIKKDIDRAGRDMVFLNAQKLFEKNVTFCNQQIRQYQNRHQNQRCFIVATGPSLSTKDLDKLKQHGEVCISMNRIYNIFERTEWRPDYYVIEDTIMIEDLRREIADLDLPVKFVPSVPTCFWNQNNIKNAVQYELALLDNGEDMPLFSSKAEKCVYEGSTVTYACIQMAAYMGFLDIYLLGVDFNYSNDLYDEKNHFQGYQSDKRVRLNAVSPKRMEAAYRCARNYAEENEIHIYNATRGGKLEVFERVEFDDLF